MSIQVLGIDISKATFDVALLVNDKILTKKYNNNREGFSELVTWLKVNKISSVHICMEATGSYWLNLAQYCYDKDFKVSVVNPARIKGFAMSRLSRTKTDKADSGLIASFCEVMKPEAWHPQPLHVRELQQLVNRLDSLIANKNQELNRLEGANQVISDDIKNHIDFLNKQIKKLEQLISNHIKNHKDLSDKAILLDSIPGIGEKTKAVVLSFLSNIEKFDSIKQVVAFIGLNPKHRQSGSSVRGISRISKTGNADLRKAFYMPAMTSLKHNPIIRRFAQRLKDNGKPKMLILIAAMRKLLHIIFGVLKNKTLFNSAIT